MENNLNDLWNDEEFGKEFAKFNPADISDSTLYEGNISVIYCKPDYKSIVEITNQWNKRRKQIAIYPIRRAFNTPYESDEIMNNSNLFLDMGARLYNAMKEANMKNYKYIKILKIASPVDKFDVQYYATEYKLITQKKLSTGKKTKK